MTSDSDPQLAGITTLPHRPTTRQRTWAWGALCALLVIGLPFAVRRPLGHDSVLYDLQARCLVDGGVLYRDIVEPNLPGVVLVHLLVRTVAGWSSEALRVADVVIVGLVIGLLCWWATIGRQSRASDGEHEHASFEQIVTQSPKSVVWLAIAMTWFYLTREDYEQCQRDLWALLPALAAMTLRWQRCHRIAASDGESLRRVAHPLVSGIVEGALWAIACWIKPHVIVPGGLVVLLSLFWLRQPRRILRDALFVLVGGGIVTAAMLIWLVVSGTWPHFLEMMTEWNPVYFRHGRQVWSWALVVEQYDRMLPWSLAPLLAIPWCVWKVVSGRAQQRRPEGLVLGVAAAASRAALPGIALPAALLIGWTVQAALLQCPFSYVQVPVVFLGLSVGWRLAAGWLRPGVYFWPVAIAAGTAAFLAAPTFSWEQVRSWPKAVANAETSGTPSVGQHRDQRNTNELDPIVEYLAQQQIKDGELTAYNDTVVAVYPRLGCRPSTRYVFTKILAQIFAERRSQISQALEESNQRFVVSDLCGCGFAYSLLDELDPEVPADFERYLSADTLAEFPFNQTAVLRSGRYVVHRVDHSVGNLCLKVRLSDARGISFNVVDDALEVSGKVKRQGAEAQRKWIGWGRGMSTP